MNISELLNSAAGEHILNTVTTRFGIDRNQAATAVNTAVPLLLSGLQNNAQNAAGAQSIENALAKHDGSLLHNMASLQNNSQALEQDGHSIVNHIFGDRTQDVQSGVAQKAGIGMDKIGPIIAMLAPIVMSYVGKQKRQQSTTGSASITDILGNIMGNNSGSSNGNFMDIVGNFLDRNKDGNYMDDIMDMFGQKK